MDVHLQRERRSQNLFQGFNWEQSLEYNGMGIQKGTH